MISFRLIVLSWCKICKDRIGSKVHLPMKYTGLCVCISNIVLFRLSVSYHNNDNFFSVLL